MAWWRFWEKQAVPEPAPKLLQLCAHVVLGLDRRPGVPVSEYSKPLVLDDSLMDDATVLLCLNDRQPSKVVWVVNRVPQPVRFYPQLPGMQANVFVSRSSLETPLEATLRSMLPDLERVYHQAILLSCHDPDSFWGGGTAQQALTFLARQHELDERQAAFVAAAEKLPILEVVTWTDRMDPARSVDDIRHRVRQVFAVEYHVERKHIEKIRRKGAECLRRSDTLRELLKAYDIPWGDEDALADMALGEKRIVASPLRAEAVEIDFGSAIRAGDKVQFPSSQGVPLVLDLAARVLSGPLKETPAPLVFAFDKLSTVAIDAHEVQGENKTATTYYLHLSDGRHNLVFKQRVVCYNEYHRSMADDYAAQDRALEILHAIPAAVGATRPRLACPDLVGTRSLLNLV